MTPERIVELVAERDRLRAELEQKDKSLNEWYAEWEAHR
jgi:uncharacterized small protein (DUF1192 family)